MIINIGDKDEEEDNEEYDERKDENDGREDESGGDKSDFVNWISNRLLHLVPLNFYFPPKTILTQSWAAFNHLFSLLSCSCNPMFSHIVHLLTRKDTGHRKIFIFKTMLCQHTHISVEPAVKKFCNKLNAFERGKAWKQVELLPCGAAAAKWTERAQKEPTPPPTPPPPPAPAPAPARQGFSALS